ncbi:MAG: hypothetical protein J6Q82_03390 [Clostridia bacterium]|nr:hypothetical protein [Clostridia bacterium]
MMKKITALALALLLCAICLLSTACSQKKDGIPEGMKSATVSGEPFILYVPESWTDNTTSGISSAYYASNDTILVSARYFTPADKEMTIDDYIDGCAERYEEILGSYSQTERGPALLGTENAVKLSYTMVKNDVAYACFQITAIYRGDLISLYGYCPTELYEARTEDYDKIASEFVFCEKTDPNGAEMTDNKTPDGMKIASADHLEYRLYVPKTWICDPESGRSEAYYPESEKSNVSLTSYSPSESISVKDYFADCEEEYKTVLPEYERLSEEETTVADRLAYSFVYRTVVDGVEFKMMQTVFTYNEIIYSLTYTAIADSFDTHLEDVEAMLSAFRFR